MAGTLGAPLRPKQYSRARSTAYTPAQLASSRPGDRGRLTLRLRLCTPGSTTALVDGQPVEMLEAPAAQDGKLAACYAVFEDAWQVSMSAAYDNWPSDNAQRVAWLVIP